MLKSPFERVAEEHRLLREQKKREREKDLQSRHAMLSRLVDLHSQFGESCPSENRVEDEFGRFTQPVQPRKHEQDSSSYGENRPKPPYSKVYRSWSSGEGAGIPSIPEPSQGFRRQTFTPPAYVSASQVRFTPSQASASPPQQEPHISHERTDGPDSNAASSQASSFTGLLRNLTRERKSRHQAAVLEAKSTNDDPSKLADLLVVEVEQELEKARQLSLHEKQKVFRDLQRRFHPDKNLQFPEAAKLAFQRLMQAQGVFLAA